MKTAQLLEKLGFSQKESDIYLSCLSLGMAPITAIAKKANLNRTTTYAVLKKLGEKGYAEFFLKGKTRYYSVTPTEQLIKKLEKNLAIFEKHLPEMMQAFLQQKKEATLTIFEGKAGMGKLRYQDFLAQSPIYCIVSPDELDNYFGMEWTKKYISKRIGSKIEKYLIMPNSPRSRELQVNADRSLRKIKLIPETEYMKMIGSHIYCYDDKIALLDIEEEVGILIENNQLAKTFKTLFFLAWKSI